MEMIIGTIETTIDSVSYVLIAFSSISLIVSSIMIAITTYVSVIERKKEIGILRSIGARKKDILRVFNAETSVIGLSSGLIGVSVAWILTIPINLIVKSYIEDISNVAVLNLTHIILLVSISVFLTLISGVVPSKIAANKNPIVALKSE